MPAPDWQVLLDTAADLSPTLIGDRAPTLGWQARPSLPPWVSASAADVVRGELRAAARDAEPLAASRAGHQSLVEIQQGACIRRPSVLYARADGTQHTVERVLVGGRAVIVARGEYRLQ